MKRILQILPELNPSGGIENVVMNYYRQIDKNKFQFDFIAHSIKNDAYAQEISNLGGIVHILPRFSPSNFPRIKKEYLEILSSKQYAAVHCNMANAAFLYLKEARKQNIPLRILHSHQNKYADTFPHALRNIPLVALGKSYANIRIACSVSSGKFLFGNKPFTLLPNAIDLAKFRFNPESRRLKRSELDILDSQFVIGNVGRLVPQKNQAFLIRLMPEVLKKNSNVILLITGEGVLESQLKRLCSELEITSSVRFLGIRTDVNDLLSAMDCFAFPSKYEGLGEALVEAEVSGLPCIASTDVPTAAKINNNCVRLARKEFTHWIQWLSGCNVVPDRDRAYINALHSDYDISETASVLEKIYDT